MKDKVIVKLENVTKSFDNNTVIKNVSLDIFEGEFLTLLGPSGCGKTTLLRTISGLSDVTSGKVYIDDKDVTNVDPTKREVNTIFQNFGLFPHMSVYDNVAFGLKMKKTPKQEIEKKVKNAIKLVNLEGLEDRVPSELSGGQQQRVAIARGIVMNPKVLLLDESLCSLDLKLKRKMQIELKKIQRKLGITFIYVTHDQDEALTMSDRIAIINKGKIEQLDTPQNIYRRPVTTFVADFIGESNIFEGEVVKLNKTYAIIKTELFEFETNNLENLKLGDKIKLLIRPETIEVHKKKMQDCFEGEILEFVYDGMITKLVIKSGDMILKVNVSDSEGLKENSKVYLTLDRRFVVPIREENNDKK